MKLESFRRINIEDYTQEEQDLIQKLASTLNVALDLIYLALSNRLTFADNIDSTTTSFTVKLDADGVPKTGTSFALNVNAGVTPTASGINVINASSTTFPTGAPFISFTQSGATISINHITGLAADVAWTLNVIAYHA